MKACPTPDHPHKFFHKLEGLLYVRAIYLYIYVYRVRERQNNYTECSEYLDKIMFTVHVRACKESYKWKVKFYGPFVRGIGNEVNQRQSITQTMLPMISARCCICFVKHI